MTQLRASSTFKVLLLAFPNTSQLGSTTHHYDYSYYIQVLKMIAPPFHHSKIGRIMQYKDK